MRLPQSFSSLLDVTTGRIDIVENRYVGIKSRGCYDSPAMTVLRWAHLDLEGLVLDGRVRSLRDQFVTQYVLAGLWAFTVFQS